MPTIADVVTALPNLDFELGDVNWTKGLNWTILNDPGSADTGGWLGTLSDAAGISGTLLNQKIVSVTPGQTISATGKVRGGGADGNYGWLFIQWYDAAFAPLSISQGNSSSASSPNTWEISTITSAVAPATAAYATLGFGGHTQVSGGVRVDSATWTYLNDRTVTLSQPVNGSTFTVGDNVQMELTTTGTSPAITSATYKDGATTLGTVTVAPYTFNTTTLAAGSHVITAQVLFANGVTTTTNSSTITVSAIPPVLTTREYKASNAYTYLIAQNFSGLSNNIPSIAKITGIEIEIDYTIRALIRSKNIGVTNPLGSNPNVLFDITDGGDVEATLLSPSGDNYSVTGNPIVKHVPLDRTSFSIVEESTSEGMKWTVLDSTPTTITMGLNTELFGLTPIGAADFITRAIGFRFLPTLLKKPSYADTGDGVFRFFLNRVRLRVYFDAGSVDYYFASADKTQVLKGQLVSSNVNAGHFQTGDASGSLQLRPTLTVMAGTQTWIGDTWTIHASYPPTNANQIGTVGDRASPSDTIGMRYNGLPSAKAVVNNRSRYEFITANFFAVKALDSIYGAHGLPRGFAYNGDFFYTIQTQPDPLKDKPRHVAYHHGHLALGFDDGRVDISVIGQPYNYDGAFGASEWSIGDKVTGLLPLSGTILGMFGSKSIWGLNGTTVDNFATQVITPNIGAIEYTVTDMGFPVYANAYGVYTLAQTQQYGDYLGTPMSQDISPWLRPRLVRKYLSDKEVVVAWPVRSKNQYRLAFSDGYVMSMTLNAGQQSAPTFSFQKYTIYP